MNDNNVKRYDNEFQFLSILSNDRRLVDKIKFSEDYFKSNLYKKFYRYLKNENKMDIERMLDYMTLEEAKDFVTKVYINNMYADSDKESMALGYAKLILEDYKKDELMKLGAVSGTISTNEYYSKLTEIVKLNCEIEVEALSKDMIDEMISDDSQGIVIDGFGILSLFLKLDITDLVTVAGTSGFGKSAFLLNLYKSLSQYKNLYKSLSQYKNLYKCHYFNLEVSPKIMIKRLLAITSDHKVDEFNKGIINEDFYIKARDKIQDNDSYIKSGSISIEELKAVTLNSLDPNKINIVFVDHIGLLETEDRNFSRNEYDKVTHCMKELRNLALDNNLIIFVASQFDRASIKTNNISMSSLKSSGEIENSSTHVLLLKESKQRETPEDQKKYYQEVTIEIAKNRNGEVRELDNYTFLKTKQIFRES